MKPATGTGWDAEVDVRRTATGYVVIAADNFPPSLAAAVGLSRTAGPNRWQSRTHPNNQEGKAAALRDLAEARNIIRKASGR